jgi:hypothetical protein
VYCESTPDGARLDSPDTTSPCHIIDAPRAVHVRGSMDADGDVALPPAGGGGGGGAAAAAAGGGRSKRPRVGVRHETILGPIEADAGVRGRARDVRETLLYLGRPARREPLLDTLSAQAGELSRAFEADPAVVIDAVMEA